MSSFIYHCLINSLYTVPTHIGNSVTSHFCFNQAFHILDQSFPRYTPESSRMFLRFQIYCVKPRKRETLTYICRHYYLRKESKWVISGLPICHMTCGWYLMTENLILPHKDCNWCWPLLSTFHVQIICRQVFFGESVLPKNLW